MPSKQELAANAVIKRLLQMRQLWLDAASAYFDPSRFQLTLQNCITTSRTVTFILQAQKSEIDGFDDWYAPHQDRWRSDPLMVWAREARNSIEKRGDLETLSQVRATIVASYMEGPNTDWIPQALFSSSHQIYRSIPERFRIPHILENGTLLIERRWVDTELPGIEILEALAQVYGELADTVLSFLAYLNLSPPSILIEGRPDAMGVLAMDRAIYLSMADGSPRGFRYFQRKIPKPNTAYEKKLYARYGKAIDLKSVKEAKTFRAVAETYFNIARNVILSDGYHSHFTFFLKGAEIVRFFQSTPPDRASKYVLMRDLAKLARSDGADGVLVIGEAWTARGDDVPKSGFASEAKNRGEILIMSGANASGESFIFEAVIQRRGKNIKKLKSLGATRVEESAFQFMLYPFMEEWGCVDKEKMEQAFKQEAEMGIENPTIK